VASTRAQDEQAAYEKVEQKYHDDREVSVYDAKRFGAPGGQYLNQRQIAEVLDLVGPNGCAVLEVGCGTGRFTFEFARAGHRVMAVDYSAAMLEKCRERQTSEAGGENVTFREASIFELPFDDASFDAVVCVHVLMHLPDHVRAIDELLRVLKPGGRLVFDIRNARSLNRLAYPLRRVGQRLRGKQPWYVWYSTLEEIRDIAAARGARMVETRGMFPLKPNQLPGFMLPLLRRLENAAQGGVVKRLGHIQMIALTKD
jgi:ubiquinone/menaquinone biosynthesis C-methylase UbiE